MGDKRRTYKRWVIFHAILICKNSSPCLGEGRGASGSASGSPSRGNPYYRSNKDLNLPYKRNDISSNIQSEIPRYSQSDSQEKQDGKKFNDQERFESNDLRNSEASTYVDNAQNENWRNHSNNSKNWKPINYQFSPNKFPPDQDSQKNTNYPAVSSKLQQYKNIAVKDDEDYEEPDPSNRILAMYKSTRGGSFAITVSSIIVGAALGMFIAKSLHVLPPTSTSILVSLFFFLSSLTKFKPPNAGNQDKSPTNPFSLLTQTLGLTFILLLQRTQDIRKQLPTKPHLANILRPNRYPRRPFPPQDNDDDDDENDSSNPWKYQIRPQDSIYMEQYGILKVLLSMAFVGAICGANMPLIPTWIGGLGGASLFCYIVTLRNSKGDLGRTMAMKVISLITELFQLNDELAILTKSGVVLNIIFDKLLILDRKHSIRHKFTSAIKWIYDQIMAIVNNVRADVEQAESDDVPVPPKTLEPSIAGRDRYSNRDRDIDKERERGQDKFEVTRQPPPPPSQQQQHNNKLKNPTNEKYHFTRNSNPEFTHNDEPPGY